MYFDLVNMYCFLINSHEQIYRMQSHSTVDFLKFHKCKEGYVYFQHPCVG